MCTIQYNSYLLEGWNWDRFTPSPALGQMGRGRVCSSSSFGMGGQELDYSGYGFVTGGTGTGLLWLRLCYRWDGNWFTLAAALFQVGRGLVYSGCSFNTGGTGTGLLWLRL